MSKRREWTMIYKAEDIAPAAEAKRIHHNGRLAFHQEEAKFAEEKLKNEGLKIKVGVAQTSQVSGQPASVSLDNQLLNELNEHQNKITEHRTKMIEYDGWYQMMLARPDAEFTLDHEDWLFFFGK